jgi:hypothetical protein
MVAFTDVWFFVLCALAVWRVAHLLISENGPWNLVLKMRTAFGFEVLSHPATCFYGLSFLAALPPALWMSSSRIGFAIQWMALSAAASLLEKIMQMPHRKLQNYPLPASYLDKVIRGI